MFIEKPASKLSLSKRRPVHGVGINDANYITDTIVDGHRLSCPFYRKWKDMVGRCYSDSIKRKQPTYKDCTVCNEWLTFSTFKSWMVAQDWKGKELDKDLLVQGNKKYSPTTCVFITGRINTLLNKAAAKRGKYKIGVYFDVTARKFKATCSDINGKNKHIGYFCTESKAHDAYKEYKYKLIGDIAQGQEDQIKSALLRYILPS